MHALLSRVMIVAFVISAPLIRASDLPAGVLVRQGGAALSLEDIDAFAARIPPDQRAGYFDSAKRLESTLRTILLDRQLANDARESGLDKDPKVQQQVRLAIDGALSNARLEEYRSKIVIPDMTDLARERYIANKQDYLLKGILDVKHILVSTDSRNDEEAKSLIEEARAKAVADPDKFTALVEEYSDDPSKVQNQGFMRDAGNKATYVGDFADAANALTTPGEISPVIKTRFGYHILILVSRTSDRQRSFDEVKDQMLAEMGDNYFKEQMKLFVSDIQNRPIESNAEIVNSLRTRYGGRVDSAVENDADTGSVDHPSASNR